MNIIFAKRACVAAAALAFGAGCGAAGENASAAAGDQAVSGTDTPAFADPNGADTNVMFAHSAGQPTVAMRGPSPELKAALDELNHQGAFNNETFTAASFTFPSTSSGPVLGSFDTLRKGHACDLDPLQIAFDAMFFSLEPKRDGEDAHNSLDSDTMSCQVVAAQPATNQHVARTQLSSALKAYRSGSAYASIVDPNNEPKISSGDLAKAVQSSSAAVHSLLKDNAGATLYGCTWGNGDDETGSALIAIDTKTGVLRVLFGYVGA
jgi:hypothetical protein